MQNASRLKSKRWNVIKKDVLPNPLLMQISERVQLIIQYDMRIYLAKDACAQASRFPY